LLRQQGPDDCVRVRLGDPVVDDYLEFVAARCRPNTVLATAYDLKVFFSVVGKEPGRVSTADVFGFLGAQRAPRRGAGVVRLEDGEAGLSARTIKRRLASVSGLFAYLVVATHNNVHWWWPVSVSTARCAAGLSGPSPVAIATSMFAPTMVAGSVAVATPSSRGETPVAASR